MNEDMMNRIMMIGFMAIAGIAGIASIFLIVNTAMDFTLASLFMTVVSGGATIGASYGTVYFGNRSDGRDRVFGNEAEREVLTPTQRRELRKARGEVVMERALIDIEHERQNITHNQIEASKDPAKPPHQTEFGAKMGTSQPVEGRVLPPAPTGRDPFAPQWDTDPGFPH